MKLLDTHVAIRYNLNGAGSIDTKVVNLPLLRSNPPRVRVAMDVAAPSGE